MSEHVYFGLLAAIRGNQPQGPVWAVRDICTLAQTPGAAADMSPRNKTGVRDKRRQVIVEKRATHLLTGLLRCGGCGGGFAAVGKDYLACSAARKQDTCTQKRSFKRHELEGIVLNLLRTRLMRPEAVAAFVASVSREMNAGRAAETAARARLTTERMQITRRLEGLYDAIADGLCTAGLKTKLEEMEAQLAEVDAKLSAPAPSPVRLHPQLSEIYRRKVEDLSATLADTEIRPAALETIRGLITAVTIHETADNGIRIDLDGAITALVGLAQPEAEAFLSSGSVEVVAGVGFEPTTFRL
jgi:site-specific DNA recombinase